MDPIRPSPPEFPSVLPRAAARPDAGASAVARDFEATFMKRTVEEMLASAAGPDGDAPGASMWRGVLAQAIADETARAGSLGIASGVRAAMDRYGDSARSGR